MPGGAVPSGDQPHPLHPSPDRYLRQMPVARNCRRWLKDSLLRQRRLRFVSMMVMATYPDFLVATSTECDGVLPDGLGSGWGWIAIARQGGWRTLGEVGLECAIPGGIMSGVIAVWSAAAGTAGVVLRSAELVAQAVARCRMSRKPATPGADQAESGMPGLVVASGREVPGR